MTETEGNTAPGLRLPPNRFLFTRVMWSIWIAGMSGDASHRERIMEAVYRVAGALIPEYEAMRKP